MTILLKLHAHICVCTIFFSYCIFVHLNFLPHRGLCPCHPLMVDAQGITGKDLKTAVLRLANSCFGKPSHNENIVFHVFQWFSAIHAWPGIQLEHRLQDLIPPGCHRCPQFVTRSMRRSVRCSWRCTAHGGLARSQEEPSELGFWTNEKTSENLAELKISRRSKPIKTGCKTDRINCCPDKTKRRLSFSGKCTRRRNQQVAPPQFPHKE